MEVYKLYVGMYATNFVQLRYKDGDRDSDDEGDENDVPDKKPKAKPKGKKPCKKKNKKKKSPKASPKVSPSKPTEPKVTDAVGKASSYKAGSFQDARLSFMRKLKADGVAWMEASKQWMSSDERAALLEGLSEGELKRRRFTGKKKCQG